MCLCVCVCDGDLIAGSLGWPLPVFIFLPLAVHKGERQFLLLVIWTLLAFPSDWRQGEGEANINPFLLRLEKYGSQANKILATLLLLMYLLLLADAKLHAGVCWTVDYSSMKMSLFLQNNLKG